MDQMTGAGAGAEVVDLLRAFVEERTPHNRALGVRLVAAHPGEVTCAIPYHGALAGNGEPGAIDQGTIATLMDVTCGSAVCMRAGRLLRMATMELRIDFVRPPRPGRALTAEGSCYQVTRSLAFVRAVTHDGDREDLVASAQGTFILTGE